MWYATVESWSKGITSSSGSLSSSSKNPVIVTPQNTLSRMKKIIIISTIVIHSSKNLLITHSTRFETTCYVHKTASSRSSKEDWKKLNSSQVTECEAHRRIARRTGCAFKLPQWVCKWNGTLVQQPLVTFYWWEAWQPIYLVRGKSLGILRLSYINLSNVTNIGS